MHKDNASIVDSLVCGSDHGAIQNSKPHDSEPLRVRAPEFLVRKMGQLDATPGANNSLCITLRSNIGIYMCTYKDTCVCVCVRVCVNICACTHAQICTHTHIYAYVCIHTCM
jgi:hypothetical protein